ncbi:hypothetical protein ACQKP0_25340 [Heyndrickxia sp. NPDC080065]|uniref:hypothetical protein n=1 Tax=Heyndrickxia sp. NPDC080065 TaxID=3390568 RepID=UPI003D01A205
MFNEVEVLPIEESVIQAWQEKAVPLYDLFFFTTIDEVKEYMPENILVIPRDEFNHHNVYQTIDTINSYEMWKISRKAKYVCVTPEELFPTIDRHTRTLLLNIQHELGRGLIYEWEILEPVLKNQPLQLQEEVWEIIESYIIQQDKPYIVFQRNMWTMLPYSFKRDILIKVAKLYSDKLNKIEGEVQEVLEQYPQLNKYMNRFSKNHGPNCLAAVLAAATENSQVCDWIINQWVHPETFKLGLDLRGYKEVNSPLDELERKDILIWQDEHDNINHATFHLGNRWFFNKNGQSFFNGWQILAEEQLYKNWRKENIRVYRWNKSS